MAGKSKSALLRYSLSTIRERRLLLNAPTKPFDPDAKQVVDYNINPTVQFHLEKEELIIVMDTTAVIKETQEELMQIEVMFGFEIKDLRNLIAPSGPDQKYGFKNPEHAKIFPVLIGLSYSTLRGIVLEKTRGTLLTKNFMPVVDPNLFVNPKLPE